MPLQLGFPIPVSWLSSSHLSEHSEVQAQGGIRSNIHHVRPLRSLRPRLSPYKMAEFRWLDDGLCRSVSVCLSLCS